MDILRIKRVLGQPDFGGCKPVWIRADDGVEYLLKFRYDGNEMDISNFNEYLSYRITDMLNYKISPQGIKFITIHSDDIILFENAKVDIESVEFAKKSLGTNLGIQKIPFAQKAESVTNSTFKKQVANIDNYVLNSDRNKENPNLLFNKQNSKYYAIDYGLALLSHRVYEKIKDGDDIGQYVMQLQNCNVTEDMFYVFKNQKKIQIKSEFKEVLDKILAIIDECPSEWEPTKYREQIAEIVAFRMLNRRLFDKHKCPSELY